MSADERADTPSGDLVLVGSSAGGIEALSVLVSTLPSDFPAPIVLAQHLDPTRPSSLGAILERRSTLPVVVVMDHTPLEAGKVYVIPSNRHVTIKDGHVELGGDHGDRPRPSVDLLLSSAARIYGEHLIAVILTGSGSDGAAGALDVKEAGGTVIIQNPQTARYPSMPMALPPTGVDHVVDLDQIGPLLYDIVKGISLPDQHVRAEDTLPDILAHVGRQANIDFRPYKPSTILRRVMRRMVVTHTSTLRDYRQYLEAHPEEVGELVMAFLIKVTEFFRDAEAFVYLREHILPRLLERGRQNGQVLRLWSAGCATGEEPYSLALLIADMLGPELPDWNIKIFATDLDENAIAFARRGLYPRNLLRSLPDEYRARFFEPVDQSYRIAKMLRQLVIFGQQDLSRGAPFPRIDLVVCRNLLIYFKPELQQHVLDLFAYSLHQVNGYLFLGKAEIVRPSKATFELIDKRWKVYQCRTGPIAVPMQPRPDDHARVPADRRRRLSRDALDEKRHVAQGPEQQVEIGQLRRFNELVLRSIPVGVAVIDRSYQIVTINGAARRILEIREVAHEQDFLHTARALPYQQVRTAIDTVFRERTTATLPEIEINLLTSGETRYVSLMVMPAQIEFGGLDAAVISVSDITEQVQARQRLETVRDEQVRLVHDLDTSNRRLSEMNKEFVDANEELQAANEELVLTQEELQATNEEFEATNEELQATNEELETNNEELQATNEELETTNEELTARTGELQELTHILEGERQRLSEVIQLAPFYIMVVRGSGLLVESFNPRYAPLLEGRQILGQPLEDVLEFFWKDGKEIVDLAREVYHEDVIRTSAKTLTFMPDVQGQPAEAYFVYTIVPSHLAGSVDAVIIYTTDVTEVRAREVEAERARLRLIFDRAEQVALALYDAQTTELLVMSPRYLQLIRRSGESDADALIGSRWQELSPFANGAEAAERWEQVLQSGASLRLPEVRVAHGQAEMIWDLSLTPINAAEHTGVIRLMLVSAIEVTEQVRAREELVRLDRLKDEFLSLASHEMRTPLTPLMGYTGMLARMIMQQGKQPDSDQLEHMGRIVEKFSNQLDHMNRLIEDMLDIGRLETGKFTLRKEPVDLAELLERAVEEAGMASTSQTIQLQLSSEGEPLLVCGDRERLLQILQNLLRNAITHAPNSDRIDVRLRRDDAAPGEPAAGMAEIAVQDYGRGIAPQDQAAIFTRFYQIAREDRPEHNGLGLGLFICKQIVEQHGGTIAVESALGEGSTFIVRLPLFDTTSTR